MYLPHSVRALAREILVRLSSDVYCLCYLPHSVRALDPEIEKAREAMARDQQQQPLVSEGPSSSAPGSPVRRNPACMRCLLHRTNVPLASSHLACALQVHLMGCRVSNPSCIMLRPSMSALMQGRCGGGLELSCMRGPEADSNAHFTHRKTNTQNK